MATFDRRPRGRNNNRRNGRRHTGSRPSQVIKLNDQGRSFNHQRVRFNGNATKLFEKYNKLAAEALSAGDRILAENYFQHADHFSRSLPLQNETIQHPDTSNENQVSSNIASSDEDIIEEQDDEKNSKVEKINSVIAKPE